MLEELALFVRAWWVQILFLAGICGTTIKFAHMWYRSVNETLKAVLHGLLFDVAMEMLITKEATIDEMDNFTTMYNAYVKLKGNGTIKKLASRIDKNVKIVEKRSQEN